MDTGRQKFDDALKAARSALRRLTAVTGFTASSAHALALTTFQGQPETLDQYLDHVAGGLRPSAEAIDAAMRSLEPHRGLGFYDTRPPQGAHPALPATVQLVRSNLALLVEKAEELSTALLDAELAPEPVQAQVLPGEALDLLHAGVQAALASLADWQAELQAGLQGAGVMPSGEVPDDDPDGA